MNNWKILFVAVFGLIHQFSAFAIGVKEIDPNDDFLALVFHKENGRYNNFMRYDSKEEERLYVSLNAEDHFYFGFKFHKGHYENFLSYPLLSDAWVRIKDENGMVVFGPIEILENDSGYIANRAQAKTGPQQVFGNNGYSALDFVAPTRGNYYVEVTYNPCSPCDGNDDGMHTIVGEETFTASEYDFTVTDANDHVVSGRVYSKAWGFTSGKGWFGKVDFAQYVYTKDRMVQQFVHNGDVPFRFITSANSTGANNTGVPEIDRMSIEDIGGHSLRSEYKLFFDIPDPDFFPHATINDLKGEVKGPVTLKRNCDGSFHLSVMTSKESNAIITLDLDGNPGFQENTEDVRWSALLHAGLNKIPWDGRNGFGDKVNGGVISGEVNVSYMYGLTHFPMYDVEDNVYGFHAATIIPTQIAGPLPLFWDDTLLWGDANTEEGCLSECQIWFWRFGDERIMNTWCYAERDSALEKFEYTFDDVVAGPDTLVCPGAEVELYASTDKNTYYWTPGEGLSDSTILNPQVFITRPKTYTFHAIDNGCEYTNEVHLDVFAPNNVSIDQFDYLCSNTSKQLEVYSNDVMSTYTWVGATEGLSAVTVPNPMISIVQPGSYLRAVEVTDRNGCKDTAQVEFEVVSMDVDIDEPEPICPGDSAQLRANGAETYLWTPAISLSDPGSNAPYAFPQTTTRYQLIAGNEYGCTEEIELTVEVHPLNPLTIAAEPSLLASGESTELIVNENQHHIKWVDVSSENVLYEGAYTPSWSVVPDSGTSYQLTATSAQGCKQSATVPVKVLFPVGIPNVFSPNGDGINDQFRIANLEGYNRPSLQIYNRWGNLVFKTSPYRNNWMGDNQRDKELPAGTYYFILDLHFRGLVHKGDLTLLR